MLYYRRGDGCGGGGAVNSGLADALMTLASLVLPVDDPTCGPESG
jgi:hypothetical protein